MADLNSDKYNVPIDKIHTNVSQVLITTTEDKLKIILMEYQNTQINSKSWVAPMGIFFTLLTTLVTSTPKDFLIPKENWVSMYVLGSIIALGFLVYSIIKSAKARKKRMSIDVLVEQIKKVNGNGA